MGFFFPSDFCRWVHFLTVYLFSSQFQQVSIQLQSNFPNFPYLILDHVFVGNWSFMVLNYQKHWHFQKIDSDHAGQAVLSHLMFYLVVVLCFKQVLICFSQLGECCNAVLQWRSSNVLWTTKLCVALSWHGDGQKLLIFNICIIQYYSF